MKAYLTIQFGKEKDAPAIQLGLPTLDDEFEQMFHLRYKVYTKKGLMQPNDLKYDRDYFDESGCHYFITKYGNKVIGSTRMIYGDVLPTEDKYFKLDLPDDLKNVPKYQKVEIGRLSSDLSGLPDAIPRHIVLLGTFYVMLKYAYENGYTIALGTLKEYVRKKFDKLGFPARYLPYLELVYKPSEHNDPLVNFFEDQVSGKVCPMYATVVDIESFLKSIFFNQFCFEVLTVNHIILKSKGRFNFLLLLKSMRVADILFPVKRGKLFKEEVLQGA